MTVIAPVMKNEVKRILAVQTAGDTLVNEECDSSSAIRITTGARIPKGANAVVMVEDTQLVEADSETGRELSIQIDCNVQEGESIRRKGSDIAKGEIILRKGHLLTSFGGELGTLITAGIQKVMR